MNKLSLLALAFLTSSITALDPTKWNLDDPTFVVDNKSFLFTYGGISDAIDPAGGDANYEFYQFDCGGDGYKNASPTLFDVDSFEKTGGSLDLSYTTVPSELSKVGALYTPGDPTSEVSFCVRVGLYSGGGANEINFLETQVSIQITLDGSFVTDSILVAPKDKTNTTSEQTYTVGAQLCDGTPPFNQGAVISVCVYPFGEAITDGIIMSSVDEFGWTRGETTQPAITGGVVADALSDIDTTDQVSFKVSSVLYATFYATTGSVTASGSATMAFPARRRRLSADGRHLQADDTIPSTPFDVSADVVSVNDGPVALTTAGGVAPSMTIVGMILGLVSAFLLA